MANIKINLFSSFKILITLEYILNCDKIAELMRLAFITQKYKTNY